jgi:hypothetical protein
MRPTLNWTLNLQLCTRLFLLQKRQEEMIAFDWPMIMICPADDIQIISHVKVFLKVAVSLGLLVPPIPSSSEVRKVKKFLLNLGMKC